MELSFFQFGLEYFGGAAESLVGLSKPKKTSITSKGKYVMCPFGPICIRQGNSGCINVTLCLAKKWSTIVRPGRAHNLSDEAVENPFKLTWKLRLGGCR